MTRKEAGVDLAVFGVALLLRLVYLAELARSPLLDLLIGDGEMYHAWAKGLAAGDWIGTGVFYHSPLYPYFLGVVYLFAGPRPLAAKLVQCLLGAVGAVLLARAGRALAGPRAGLVAGLALACHPTAIFSDGLIQKSSLDTFFTALLLALACGDPRGFTRGRWAGIGSALGLLVLTRENALTLLPALLIWIAVATRPDWRASGIRMALLGAGLAAVLLPVGVRNLAVGGEFHLTTSQFGANFYIGNRAGADGLYAPLRPGRGFAAGDRGDAAGLAAAELGRPLSPREVSAYWTRKTHAEIAADPVRWLRLLLRKLLLLVNRVEVADTDDEYTYGDWSLVLRLAGLLLNFGVLIPLAAAGAMLTLPRWRDFLAVHLTLLFYAAGVLLFFVFGRYRFPLVPGLVLLAAAGLAHVPVAWRSERRRLGQAAGVLLLAIPLANWPLIPDRPVIARSVMYNNIGAGLWNRDRDPAALPWFRKSFDLVPTYADPHRNLGAALRHLGRDAEAAKEYRWAVELQPGGADSWEGYGIALTNLGRTTEALDAFNRALALDDTLATSHWGSAINLGRLGRREEALGHYAVAARLDSRFARPDNPAVRGAAPSRGE
jgi:4-amino-4-deoxy-L-arabinose transferase-like glycosyltransferase